jgi:hypothetical protein
MATITTSTGLKLSIDPLVSSENSVLSCHIEEEVGGSLPLIKVRLALGTDPCSVLDVMDVKIVNDTGWCVKFKAYVYQIGYAQGEAEVRMFGCLPDFVRTPRTEMFEGVDAAIDAVWDGVVDKNTDTDTPPSLRLYQRNESGHKFLRRIMSGYKFDTVWGLGISGLCIRDMNNWVEEFRFSRKYDAAPKSMPSIGSPKLHDEEVEVLETFANHYKVRFGQQVLDVDKEYFLMMRNTMHNSKLTTSKADIAFSAPTLAPCCLGAHIAYESSDTDVKRLFLSARTIDVTKVDAIINYSLKSFNP